MAFEWRVSHPPLGIIARELALDISHAAFSPDLVEHIPGISNKAADILSRRYQPGHNVSLPTYLELSAEQRVEYRPKTWWKSLPDKL